MALAINFNNVEFKLLKLPNAPKRSEESNNNIRLKSKKCLFGPTNQEETYQMVKENFDIERERFFHRFGIHMEDLDRIAINEEEYRKLKYQSTIPAPSSSIGGGKMTNKKTIRMKRALKPYNVNYQQQPIQSQHQQMKITDFCQVKKTPTSTMPPVDIAKKLSQQIGL